MANNYSAVIIFNRQFIQEQNRFERESDLIESLDESDVLGPVYFFPKVLGNDSVEDLFLVDIKYENIDVNDLYYYYAGRVCNASDYLQRIVELHVFFSSEVEELVKLKDADNFNKLKMTFVSPKAHLIFNNGKIEYFGEMYDIPEFM
jgi:hypothetical protein